MRCCFTMLFLFISIGYSQTDSTVKLFSTDLMRTNVLTGKSKESVKRSEAHFRAVYYPSGELKCRIYSCQLGQRPEKKSKITWEIEIILSEMESQKTGINRWYYQERSGAQATLPRNFG